MNNPRPLSTSPFRRAIAIVVLVLVSYYMYQWSGILIPSILMGIYCLWLTSCILRLTWMSSLFSFFIVLAILCILLSPFTQHMDTDYDFEPRHMEKR